MDCANVVKSVAEKMSQSKSNSIDSLMDEWIHSLPDSLNERLVNSIAQSHWYSYYDSAFDKLLTSHWNICMVIIAIATILVSVKFYYDHQKFKEMIAESQKNLKEKINLLISSAMNDYVFMQHIIENKITFLSSLTEWKTSNKDFAACLKVVECVCKHADSIEQEKEASDYCLFIEKEFDLVYKEINAMNQDEKKKFLQLSCLLKNVLDKKIGDIKSTIAFTEFWKYINEQFGSNNTDIMPASGFHEV